MGIVIKQSIRNALISYTGIVLGFISTIKLFPNILDADQFGLTRTMLAISFIGAQVISLGLPSSIVKFFTFFSSKTNKQEGIIILFCFPIVLAFLAFSFAFILVKGTLLGFYEETVLMTEYYFLILPLILFSALFNVFKSHLSANLNTVFASFLQDIFIRIVVIFDLLLFYFDYISFNNFVVIFVFNYGLQFLILALYGLQKKFVKFKLPFEVFTKPVIKKVTSFSLYSFLGGLTMIIIGNIDIVMLSTIKGLSSTAIYSIAFYVGSVISVPRKSISKISLPLISQYFEQENYSEVNKIYKQTSLNQFLFGFLLFIGVWANIDNLYSMLPDEYAAGSLVIIIIGAANLFDMVTGANSEIIVSSKFYRFGLYFSLFLVVLAISLNLILIPIYGILGAAIATASALFIYNLAKLIFVWRKLSIQPFELKLIGVFFNGLFVLFLSFQLPPFENIYLDIIIRSVLMALIYMSVVWGFNLSTDVTKILNSMAIKFKR